VLLAVAAATAQARADALEDIINQASISEYQSYLRVLTGVDPTPNWPYAYFANRASFTPQGVLAGQYLEQQFKSFGLEAKVHAFDDIAPCSFNIIGELPGTTRPEDIYILCARVIDHAHRAWL
jgi:hypothetical protein